MTATNALVGKKALIDLLAGKTGEGAALEGIQVAYGYPARDIERQLIWGGAARFERNFEGLRGPRDEIVTVELFVDVRALGFDVAESDERLTEIGDAIESLLLAEPDLAGTVPGLLYRSIAGGETSYWMDDDAATSSIRYDVMLRAHLR